MKVYHCHLLLARCYFTKIQTSNDHVFIEKCNLSHQNLLDNTTKNEGGICPNGNTHLNRYTDRTAQNGARLGPGWDRGPGHTGKGLTCALQSPLTSDISPTAEESEARGRSDIPSPWQLFTKSKLPQILGE